jgi:hypothetical protein
MNRRAVVAAVLAGVFVLGCSSTTTVDQGKMRKLIEEDLAADLGLPLTNASCPEVKEPTTGTEFECTATLDGQTLRIKAVVTDGKTVFVEAENADAIIPVTDLESTIADDFTEQLGTAITVSCGNTRVIVAAPGSQFECEASDGTDTVPVRVDVLDAQGNVSYETVG